MGRIESEGTRDKSREELLEIIDDLIAQLEQEKRVLQREVARIDALLNADKAAVGKEG